MKCHVKIKDKITLVSDYVFNSVISPRLLKEMIAFICSTKVGILTITIDCDYAKLYLHENKLLEGELHAVKFLIGDLAGNYSLRVDLVEENDEGTLSLIRM